MMRFHRVKVTLTDYNKSMIGSEERIVKVLAVDDVDAHKKALQYFINKRCSVRKTEYLGPVKEFNIAESNLEETYQENFLMAFNDAYELHNAGKHDDAREKLKLAKGFLDSMPTSERQSISTEVDEFIKLYNMHFRISEKAVFGSKDSGVIEVGDVVVFYADGIEQYGIVHGVGDKEAIVRMANAGMRKLEIEKLVKRNYR